MFRHVSPKKLVVGTLSLAILCLGTAVTAQADQITVMGLNAPNLRATINITALTAGSITFQVTNVLVPGVTSTLTSVGFELPGTITANTPGVCAPNLAACNNYTLAPVVSNSPGNVPGFNSAVLDWAVLTGPNFAGGNPPGINQNGTATFTIAGGFTGLTQANFLNGAYVRFQSVVDPAFPNVTSDVAHTPVPGVPEPGSLVLLGIGLSAVGLWSKRRQMR